MFRKLMAISNNNEFCLYVVHLELAPCHPQLLYFYDTVLDPVDGMVLDVDTTRFE